MTNKQARRLEECCEWGSKRVMARISVLGQDGISAKEIEMLLIRNPRAVLIVPK